ncbi:hypothetical protein [Methanobacterium sp. SMA-27]|uniref:hypothetical protein n=1 Tax=Methanobacterium sp. SMA-27 TaxID=1495336 RepID=UPI00064E5653|nr:hypothetical protein [Methanobacterium sp. SMA-27]
MPRTVYMNSDLIKDKVTDLNFLQSIGKTLDFYGVPYKAFPYETSPHYVILKKAPADAVILHNSLMCAGTIVDVCTKSYKILRANQKFLWNFKTGTEDYAFNVDYLPRAKDDNFSPASFKGLNQPIRYMVQNGGFNVSSTTDPRKIGRQLAMMAYMP